MLEKVTDSKGRCVCYVDAATGEVEIKTRRETATTCIPVGGEYRIERDNTVTILWRCEEEMIKVINIEMTED